MSDDALWQALGGGRGFAAAAQNGVSYTANAIKGNGNGNGNGNGGWGAHARTRSQGHPEYPQMSPYDEDDGGEKVGLGAVGAVRPVSLPPPLGWGKPAEATLSGPFVAGFH